MVLITIIRERNEFNVKTCATERNWRDKDDHD